MHYKCIAAAALTLGAAFAQPREIRFDGGRQDTAWSIVTDASANLYLAGLVEDTSKSSSFAVVKYNASSQRAWTAHLSTLPDEFSGAAVSVAADSAGNTYAAGYILRRVGSFATNVDWVVVSFSPSGSQRWVHRFKGAADNSSDSARSVLLSPSGELYVSGVSGINNGDWKVIKYSTSGVVLWQSELAGAANGDDLPTRMTFDPAGNLLIAGLTTNGAFAQSHDITLAKYTPDGNLLWRREFSNGDRDDDLTGGLAVDISGNIYVTGTTSADPESQVHAMLVKWDSNGQRVFAKIGDAMGGADVLVDGAGDIVTAGPTFLSGVSGVSVSKLDAEGNVKWSTSLAGSGILGTDVARSIYVAGSALNPGSTDNADFFAAKLTPAGAPIWQHRHPAGLQVASAKLNVLGEWIVAGSGPTGSSSFMQDILLLNFPAGFSSVPVAGPTAPTGLTASGSSRSVNLAWSDRSSDETGFRIERCEGNGCSNFVQIAQVAANQTRFTDLGLARKTTYSYRVRSFNANGNSVYSNTASARAGN